MSRPSTGDPADPADPPDPADPAGSYDLIAPAAPRAGNGRGATAPSHRARRRARPDAVGRVREPRTGVVWTAFCFAAALAVLCAAGGDSFSRAVAFLDFGAGVLALVALTAATLWGLAATDRVLFGPDHRLLAQAVHRGLAVAGIGFLALHVWVKIAAGSVTLRHAALPFAGVRATLLTGLGTIAAYLFLAVAVTGAVRGAFARSGRSRWWRGLHMGAYLAWGMSLVHGLKAGRAPAAWVTALYVLALLTAVALLAARLAPGRNPPRRSPPHPPAPASSPPPPPRRAQRAPRLRPFAPGRDAPRAAGAPAVPGPVNGRKPR